MLPIISKSLRLIFASGNLGAMLEQCEVNLNSTVSNLVEIRPTGSRYIYRGMIFLHSVIKITPTMAYTAYTMSRGGAVGTVTAYGLDDRGVGVRVPVGSKFSLLHTVQTGSGVHPASYSMGNGVSFPGVKRQGLEADHSPLANAEVKKIWIYVSTPPYVFMA
jgi:hypothetical protein